MRVKITAEGNEQCGAWRGEHDDVVFAVALAYWRANEVYPSGGPGSDDGTEALMSPGWTLRSREVGQIVEARRDRRIPTETHRIG